MAKPDKPRRGPRAGGLRGVVDGLLGARLCYGEPVTAGERTVIPVARVTFSGGGGWGSGGPDEAGAGGGGGGGGGGHLDGRPVGFIELDESGAQFHPIADPDQLGRTLRAVAGAAATLATGWAAARRLRGGATGRRALLPRGDR